MNIRAADSYDDFLDGTYAVERALASTADVLTT